MHSDTRYRRSWPLAALIAASAAMPARAEHRQVDPEGYPSHYLVTGVDYLAPDSGRGVDSGMGVDFGWGGSLGKLRSWEAHAFARTLETGKPGLTDYYQFGAGVDLQHAFGPFSDSHLYGLLGLGAVQNDVTPDAEDGISAYFNAGIGWRSAPWKDWNLRHRFEVRAIYDTFGSGQTDLVLGFALEIPPNRETIVEKIVEVEKVVEVPKIVEVEKIVERIVEVPAPAPVPAAPPADTDGDGVPDAQDQCSDTVAGAKVEPDGCVRKEQVIVLPSIEFEFEKAKLKPQGRERLQPVVAFLKQQPEVELDVWGHTDLQGPEYPNQRLSDRRAAAVRDYLVEQGIAPERLKSQGFGETRPLVPGTSLAANARNRRVELHIRTHEGAAGGTP